MENIQDLNDLPDNINELKKIIRSLVEELQENEMEIEKAGSIGSQLLEEMKRMQENVRINRFKILLNTKNNNKFFFFFFLIAYT